MITAKLRDSTVAEVMAAPNIETVLSEYAIESRTAGLPEPAAQWDTYALLEKSGKFHIVAAFDGPELVGALFFFVSALPKYGVKVGVSESFFVRRSYRDQGIGLALLGRAEKRAKAEGAKGMLMSAPTGGDFAEVLPKIDYAECAIAFFKGFPD